LKSQGCDEFQADLGIELINAVFSREGFQKLFAAIHRAGPKISRNSRHILRNQASCIQTIDPVMSFLQYRDNTLAQLIGNETFLARASRFDSLPDPEWLLGNIGINGKARFLATLCIEDISDLTAKV